MKKTTLIIALLLASAATFAQNLTSKKGETMLPEEGDYAIGFDAAPFLDYVGNFLNGDGSNNAPTLQAPFGNTSNPSIVGKYFADAQTAYRGRVRLGFGTDKDTFFTKDLSPDAGPEDRVEDEFKTSYNQITLGGGVEKRRGNTRIQGIYGGEALITLGSSKTTSTYGNDIEDTGEHSRVIESKSGSTIGFGVAAFVGAEYFILPKISVNGEFRWGLLFSNTGAGSVESETFNGTDTETVTVETGKTSSLGVDTGVIGSFGLGVLFHF